MNGGQTDRYEIGQHTREWTLTRRAVHGAYEILYGLEAGILRNERHQVVLDEQAHARVSAKVAIVLENALNDRCEHLDDDV